MHQQSKLNVKTLALIGVMSALVFAASTLSIPIGETARIHFGNILCLLSGLLFGPWIGGITAGLGSMFYDFTNPLFMPEFWITFIMKFAMGFTAGMVNRKLENRLHTVPRMVVAGVSGQLLYIALYLFKSAIMQHFVMGNPWAAVGGVLVVNATVSLLNGGISVLAAVLLAPPLRAALGAAGLFRSHTGHRPA